eukprot:5604464-Lingulodinium_polyedra.AAC.1
MAGCRGLRRPHGRGPMDQRRAPVRRFRHLAETRRRGRRACHAPASAAFLPRGAGHALELALRLPRPLPLP